MEAMVVAKANKIPFFQVLYKDDRKKQHLTVARNKEELKFLINRFEVVTYSVITP